MRTKIVTAAVAGALSLVAAPAAQGATATLGSPLTNPLSPQAINTLATVRQTALPGATLTSPFNGVITSWRLAGASGGWSLQVIHPAGNGLFTSTGSVHSGTLTGTGTVEFAANLPISAGDGIGLRPDSSTDRLGVGSPSPTVAFDAWRPPLTDGGPARPPNETGDLELGFNATAISNCVVPKVKGKTLKKAKRKLLAAGCRKGKVKKKGGKKVTKQKPAPGTELPPNSPVKLILG
ncbi:MAG TPA: PASTA domain-containing protein [Solirubrobacterales bacterium]|nr:PASTA domain-containing protein [Solirubrobacterales bacterium]